MNNLIYTSNTTGEKVCINFLFLCPANSYHSIFLRGSGFLLLELIIFYFNLIRYIK